MSHGSTDKCEPNFTPLLDLVLQLVMFFMLVANFVMEQTAEEIKLPEAVSAKPMEKNEESPFFLNINKDGLVVLTPDQRLDDKQATLDNQVQVQRYMENRAAIEKRRANNKDQALSTLILRVDERTQFEKTYSVMKACRSAGYTKVQLRVMRSNKDR